MQGSTVFEMRYLATIVSNCFLAFGEILQMQTRVRELSAGVSRVSQLLATAEAAEDLQRDCTASNITGPVHNTRAPRLRKPLICSVYFAGMPSETMAPCVAPWPRTRLPGVSATTRAVADTQG